MGRRNKRQRTRESMDVSGYDPGTEDHQSVRSERSSKKAGIDSPFGVENKRPSGLDCSDCLDFELDLAKSVLKYYQHRLEVPELFEEVEIWGACFLNSWKRHPSSRFGTTDKCHISFSAKPRSDGYGGVSPIWFFAELIEIDGEFRPTLCEILNPSETVPRQHVITFGCGMCPVDRKFPHPPREGEGFFTSHPSKVFYEHKAVTYKHHHRPFNGLSKFEAAKIALTYDRKDSMYKVKKVVFLEKMPFFWVEIGGTNLWYHVGFTAAAKPGKNSSSDSSPKLFFGELKFVASEKKFVPTCCFTLDTTSTGSRGGCGFCPPGDKFLHPSGGGYVCGAWRDPPPLEFTESSDNYD